MKDKITVIYHSADFDGLFCREIARKFLPDAELIGWDYGDPKLDFPEGQVYVLDLCPETFTERSFTPNVLDRLIWIDHHASAIRKYPETIPGYRIDGVAACRLAWQWFTMVDGNTSYGDVRNSVRAAGVLPMIQDFKQRTVNEPLAVRLAGEYDIWDKCDPNAEVFQFGLRSKELSTAHWMHMLDGDTGPDQAIPHRYNTVVLGLLSDGRMLQAYQQRNDAGMMGRSFIVEFEGVKFLALTTARCNSLTFASKDVPETGHDALMGFYFTGKEWTVSLYHAKHRTDLALSQIAVKYGGGGHRGACGFRMAKLPWLP